MKHHVFAIVVILCLALLCSGCSQDIPAVPYDPIPSTDGTLPSRPAHTHLYRVTEEVEPTCTEDGYNIVACLCGDNYNVTTRVAKGHNLQYKDIIAPTETEGGYTLYICQRCGAEQRSDETASLEEIKKKTENLRFTQDSDGKLFYYYEEGKNSTPSQPVCDEPVVCYADDDIFLYFVKESEPQKLYYAPLTDLSIQASIYESDYGAISYIQPPYSEYKAEVLTLTEGYKRGVILDLVTFEITPIVLPSYLYCIDWVEVDLNKDENGNWTYDEERISIAGKLTPDDYGGYFLDIRRGLIREWDGGWVMINGEWLNSCVGFLKGILFAKASEPAKLYYAPSDDITQHTLIYESTNGPIGGLYWFYEFPEYVCMTLDKKSAILLDTNTGKTEVFLEKPYIARARIRDLEIVDGKPKYNIIYFEGKKSADEDIKAYLYHIDTGVYERVGGGWW